MKKNIGAILAVAAVMSLDGVPEPFKELEEEIKNKKPNDPKPKKGQKTYFFTYSGTCSDDEWVLKDLGIVFKCFAINEKNAKKKFNKWSAQQSNNKTK